MTSKNPSVNNGDQKSQINRRRVLKTIGATGITGAGLSISPERVSAEDCDDICIVYLHPREGVSSTRDYAFFGRDALRDHLVPQLGGDVTVDAYVGDEYPKSDESHDEFISWLDDSGRLLRDGDFHVQVRDDPYGGSSYISDGGNPVKCDFDKTIYWNAGRANLLYSKGARENIIMHEVLHGVVPNDWCPEDTSQWHDDHNCGEVRYYSTSLDRITPLITTYANGNGKEVTNSCNGELERYNAQEEHVQDLSSCTSDASSKWLSDEYWHDNYFDI